jgi:hypothetical protein
VASADRQRDVSALSHREDVPNPSSAPDGSSGLLLRLIGAAPGAADAVLESARTSEDPSLLVAAALLSGDQAYLARATELARTIRERQLVVLVEAHLHGRVDLFDVLVRDHLAEHPDHLLAAWIAGRAQ